MSLLYGSRSHGPYASSSRPYYSPSVQRLPAASASAVTAVTSVTYAKSPPSACYVLPSHTINNFLRDAAAASLTAPHNAPTALLSLTNVPRSAVELVERHLRELADGPALELWSISRNAKFDYTSAAKELIITCAGQAHNSIADLSPSFMALITANNSAFTANDPHYAIVSSTDANIPLDDGLSHRCPDGSMKLADHGLPPFLIWEVLDSQPLSHMKKKIMHYFAGSKGLIRFAIIMKLERQTPPRKRVVQKPSQPSDDESCSSAHNSEPELPPPGRLVRGVFWVLTHETTASGTCRIVNLVTAQEFYPAVPPGALQLTWDKILDTPVPQHLRDQVLDIPYSILHERFVKVVAEADVPAVVEAYGAREQKTWDFEGFVAFDEGGELSEPSSEPSVEDTDGSFVGRGVWVRGNVRETRSGKLRGGGGAGEGTTL